jgi:hypothetical protein
LRDVVNAIKAIPYGRPTQPTAARCVAEWRGTCSTKHLLLELVLCERWPETLPRLVHRVYRLTGADALARYGRNVAAAVPEDGLLDVHRYALILLQGRDVVLDVTFPAADDWDGKSSMPLACGDGDDYPAGADSDQEKRNLEHRFCDPRVRETFIAALTQHT